MSNYDSWKLATPPEYEEEPIGESLDDIDRLYETIFPCRLCGGRVKPWLQPPGATSHSNCTWLLAENLKRLARNLAIAAALAKSFELGMEYATSCDLSIEYGEPMTAWHPGCLRAVDGGER